MIHFHRLGQIFSSKFSFQKPSIYWLLFILISMIRMYSRLHFKNNIKFSTNVSLLFDNEVHLETGRYSTMPTVISATVSAEHTLKHTWIRETAKGFPATKPSILLDSHWADGIYFETKNICTEQSDKVFMYVNITYDMKGEYNTVIPATPCPVITAVKHDYVHKTLQPQPQE